MTGDKLYVNCYEPGLVRHDVNNIVLRTYTHIKGFATDDPDNSTELIFTPRQEVDRRLDDIFAQYGGNRGVAVTSLVSVKTVQKYLFLLDCHLKVSDENEKELLGILRSAAAAMPALKDGLLLRTKNSYQVVGFVPLDRTEWEAHMARAILLHTASWEPVADVRYVGHSLGRGYGSLRISDYLDKPTPDFVCFLTGEDQTRTSRTPHPATSAISPMPSG